MERAIGKNTLGGGSKMNVDLKTYNRHTANLSRVFRSTMSVGTLVPFLCDVAQRGDTWDIKMNTSVLTHPTVGPLFGSYKVQYDIFLVPIRLYNSRLHNNELNIGMNMSQIMLPQVTMDKNTIQANHGLTQEDWNKLCWNGKKVAKQIDPSCILSYLGLKGYWGKERKDQQNYYRQYFQCVPWMGYLDIFKNFYANTQEDKFYGIVKGDDIISNNFEVHTYQATPLDPIQTIFMNEAVFTFTHYDKKNEFSTDWYKSNVVIKLVRKDTNQSFPYRKEVALSDIFVGAVNTMQKVHVEDTGITTLTININQNTVLSEGNYLIESVNIGNLGIKLQEYNLKDLDDMRADILYNARPSYDIAVEQVQRPTNFKALFWDVCGMKNKKFNSDSPQVGLLLKTHQSDIFNNWLKTETIEGTMNSIAEMSAIAVEGGKVYVDSINLSKKVYELLNRVALSGGTYEDWLNTVYTHGEKFLPETPVYCGGMSGLVEFQEVVSTSDTENNPLGTLAGRGKITRVKNGTLKVRVTEPSFIMGIASITPYCDYSQGNEYFYDLRTMDDFHKPALDGIGFQDMMLNHMAWFASPKLSGGKQPAWIDYLTSYNRTYGNFAAGESEAFMCLNRHYEPTDVDDDQLGIANVTSYINPEEFNYIFADTDLNSMNFWVQIGMDIECRRLISAKQIPNF